LHLNCLRFRDIIQPEEHVAVLAPLQSGFLRETFWLHYENGVCVFAYFFSYGQCCGV